MLGLAVLFFLGLWAVITIVAMIIGWKILKRWGIKSGLFGAFLGFMLTMGGFIVYWTVEYIQIQRTVTHLCETEGGITVYVTPEEWRKQIGEEEWAKSFYTGESSSDYYKNNYLIFSDKNYHFFGQINQRLIKYISSDFGKKGDIYIDDSLLYDIKLKKVLYHKKIFSASSAPSISESLESLKFWLDYGIHNCGWNDPLINEYQYVAPKQEYFTTKRVL